MTFDADYEEPEVDDHLEDEDDEGAEEENGDQAELDKIHEATMERSHDASKIINELPPVVFHPGTEGEENIIELEEADAEADVFIPCI